MKLENTDSSSLAQSLISCLNKNGIDGTYLQNHLICFAADGASAMLGHKTGVAAILKRQYPNILIWHCANHRLELAVSDTIKEIGGMNNLQSFFDKLYSTYHASPKNKRELKIVQVK